MAKGGAFGNPLTTGIALNFEVDMTPYRQMMQDNLKFAQTQAAERKAKEKEFQDILKNITYDDSKILKRRRDGARVEYASLINDVINLNKNGDRGGVQNRITDFTSGMNNLVDEKTNFNLYEKAAREGKSWTSAEYINAMNGLNEGETSDESMLSNFPDELNYDSKSGTFTSQAIPKADAMSWANKILQGMPLKSTNLKPELVPETGEYRFPLSKVEDPEAFYKEMGALWLGGGESNVETMRREMGLTSDALDGTGAIDNSTEYMRSLFQDKVGGDRYGRPLAAKEYKGWSFGGGGAKSPNWEVNKVSNIPVSLTDEVGGSLSGWKVDYIKQEGVSEIERNIELGKGSYFAEGGSKIQKVSDAATGLGKIIKGTPAGVYVRDDKKGGQLWVAYETNYIPPTDKLTEGFERYYDPDKKDNNGNIITKDEQKQAFMATRVSEDKDLISKTTKRIVYVPIKSDSEKIEFRTTMGMSSDDFNKLTDMIGFSSKSGTPPSGGAASASSSSSASVPSSDIQKMSGMKYGDFNNASNKAWVDETAKKIRSMSNLDDLWKQTGKSGTPNGQSNAELLAGFVESGKTSLLTGTPGGANTPSFQ